MKRIRFASILGAIVAFGWAAEVRAQATPYEVNLHLGGFRHDGSDDTDVMVGGRVMLQYPSGWGWGGNFDWVKLDEAGGFGDDDIDFNLYLYSFEIDYTFPSTSRTKFFVGGGVGGATFKASDLPDGVDVESDTEALVPLAAGVKYGNQPVNPTWAVRGDIRDNIIFGDETSHNLEFSGGVSFFF